MAKKKKKLKKFLTLGEVGFAMKYEASKVEGNTMVVDKALWLEIAELLMQTDRNLKECEVLPDSIGKEGVKDEN